jgi:hypothetical protein
VDTAVQTVKAHLFIFLLIKVQVNLLLEVFQSRKELFFLCLRELLPISELLQLSCLLIQAILMLSLPSLRFLLVTLQL